jgi:Cyclin, N-terminal domain
MNGAVEKRGSSAHGIKPQIVAEPVHANSTMSRQNNFGKFDEPIMEDHNPTVAPRPVASMFQRPNNMAVSSGSYQYSGQVDNIDERDMDDPLCATEYVQDMYMLFREREPSTSVRPVYMENQPHINERMRSILVDWLVEVHLKFKLGMCSKQFDGIESIILSLLACNPSSLVLLKTLYSPRDAVPHCEYN